VADRVRASLDGRIKVATGTVELRASVGVALSTASSNADALVAQADRAMYESKRLGSVEVQVFSSV
jgi:GGDEF domain-containing protein